MLRASPRRLVFLLAILLSGFLLLGNIQQTFRFQSLNIINHYDTNIENKTVSDDSQDIMKDSDEENEEFPLSSPTTPLPWYMEKGVSRPSSEDSEDLAIFPEDDPGEDRITSKEILIEKNRIVK